MFHASQHLITLFFLGLGSAACGKHYPSGRHIGWTVQLVAFLGPVNIAVGEKYKGVTAGTGIAPRQRGAGSMFCGRGGMMMCVLCTG